MKYKCHGCFTFLDINTNIRNHTTYNCFNEKCNVVCRFSFLDSKMSDAVLDFWNPKNNLDVFWIFEYRKGTSFFLQANHNLVFKSNSLPNLEFEDGVLSMDKLFNKFKIYTTFI